MERAYFQKETTSPVSAAGGKGRPRGGVGTVLRVRRVGTDTGPTEVPGWQRWAAAWGVMSRGPADEGRGEVHDVRPHG